MITIAHRDKAGMVEVHDKETDTMTCGLLRISLTVPLTSTWW